ncbi:MAG TPA: GIY-YIG nuclease family protein, partial [Sphingomicrobium sp.]|nr:GIY-YIG nuclease family protein [Sphingomicrobium sp.]
KAGTQLNKTMSRDYTPTVYMLASRRNGTLYTGVTSAPLSRWHQHRTSQVRGFTRVTASMNQTRVREAGAQQVN